MDAIIQLCEEQIYYFKYEEGVISGYLKGYKEICEFYNSLKLNNCQYAIRSSRMQNKNESVSDGVVNFKSCSIRVDSSTGRPYYNGKETRMNCIHGVRYYKPKEPKAKPLRNRKYVQHSIKYGCPSKMIVMLRHVFTEERYWLRRNPSHYSKDKMVHNLKEDLLRSSVKPTVEDWFFIRLTLHHNHELVPLELVRESGLGIEGMDPGQEEDELEQGVELGPQSPDLVIDEPQQGQCNDWMGKPPQYTKIGYSGAEELSDDPLSNDGTEQVSKNFVLMYNGAKEPEVIYDGREELSEDPEEFLEDPELPEGETENLQEDSELVVDQTEEKPELEYYKIEELPENPELASGGTEEHPDDLELANGGTEEHPDDLELANDVFEDKPLELTDYGTEDVPRDCKDGGIVHPTSFHEEPDNSNEGNPNRLARIRLLLNAAIDMTYTIKDDACLDSTIKTLTSVVDFLQTRQENYEEAMKFLSSKKLIKRKSTRGSGQKKKKIKADTQPTPLIHQKSTAASHSEQKAALPHQTTTAATHVAPLLHQKPTTTGKPKAVSCGTSLLRQTTKAATHKTRLSHQKTTAPSNGKPRITTRGTSLPLRKQKQPLM